MSEALLLYKLQTLDLDLEETNQSLQNVESQIGESEDLISARHNLDVLKDRLHQVETSLKEAEWDVDKLQNKIKPFEAKLYGGTVKNPKELDSIEKEVHILKQSKRQAEDRALDLMSESEELQDEFRKAQADLAAVEAVWKAEQENLRGEKERLSDHLQQVDQARQALLAQVQKAALQTYEGLRRTRRGRAVATVEQNTCQGCRVALPMQEVMRARTSPGLCFCSSCGRILLVTR